MILYQGTLYPPEEQDALLDGLERDINHTRATQRLELETVLDAFARLGKLLETGQLDDAIAALGLENKAYYLDTLAAMLRREAMLCRVETELGRDFFTPAKTVPPPGQAGIAVRPVPLGTLLHIAAGNMDGLPAFSVAEGLLTGNVNILKLPQVDRDVSLTMLLKLLELEPRLAPFVYVFDTPSTDIGAIQRLCAMADGIVTWGGDAAIAAVRRGAPLGVKLIEWGHRLSFAYLSDYGDRERELTALAEHIMMTKQLLCSSCQTIYLDTEQMEQVYAFCGEFLGYLERAAERHPNTAVGTQAEITLRKYCDSIERAMGASDPGGERTFQGEGCSLIAREDSDLELSYLFGNCLVKRLPRARLFDVLRAAKGYLQTAGLICSPDRRDSLTDLLARSGVVRITTAGHMSQAFCGEAHDGEYPLRRYVRIVNCE